MAAIAGYWVLGTGCWVLDADFTVVFSRYVTDDPDLESTSIRIASLVFDEAEKRH